MENSDIDKETLLSFIDDLGRSRNWHLGFLIEDIRPRQVELFWVNEPLEYQFFIVTHDHNRPDGEVYIHEKCSTLELIDVFEDALDRPRFYKPIDGDKYQRTDPSTGMTVKLGNRSELVVHQLQGLDQMFGEQCFREESDAFTRLTPLDGDNILLEFKGNIFNYNSVEDLIIELFDPPDLEFDSPPNDSEEIEEETDEGQELQFFDFNGLGTYFFEPIWVEKEPELSFRDRLLIDPPWNYDSKYISVIDENQIVLSQEGFLGIKDVEIETALNILNTIFGASVLLGQPFEAATQNDIIGIKIEDGEIEHKSGKPNLRGIHASPLTIITGRVRTMSPPIERTVVDIDYIENLFSLSKKIYWDSTLNNRTKSALQAYTHFTNGEYTQAFLLAWISIEQYINNTLDKHLKENKDVNSTRRREFKRGGHWSSSHLIEVMEISECISGDRYGKLDNFRSRRNEIVHEVDSAEIEESQEIVNLAFQLIDEKLRLNQVVTDYVSPEN